MVSTISVQQVAATHLYERLSLPALHKDICVREWLLFGVYTSRVELPFRFRQLTLDGVTLVQLRWFKGAPQTAEQ